MVFDELQKSTTEMKVKTWATLSAARALYLQKRWVQSAELIDRVVGMTQDPRLRGFAHYLKGCANLQQGRLELAQQDWETVWIGHPLADRALWLSGQAQRLHQAPEKSPVVAGVLSFFPGLGHVYLEEYSIAFMALVWNGLFGWATYDAFHKRNYGVGSLLAVLELLWYSGTIYGAISGAYRYNRDVRLNALERLEEEAGLDIPFPDEA